MCLKLVECLLAGRLDRTCTTAFWKVNSVGLLSIIRYGQYF
jgi:hypothetical protein